jgi:hypothetical protein
MRRWGHACAVAMVLLMPGARADAQQGTGELRGEIVDSQGGALPGVAVVARHQDSGLFRESVTTGDGTFFLGAMTPGVYELIAELQGFARYQQRNVRIEVGRTGQTKIVLQVGALEEAITVTGTTPLVDVSSKEIGGNVSTQELADLPSMNRNFTSYLGLLPGVVSRVNPASFGADDITANGQANANVSYTLDGSNNNEALRAGNGGAQARIAVESVQEFQLLTSQFDAEFGGSSGAIVNAVSKQGTNRLRGSAFYFFQDDALSALDYFAAQRNLEKAPTRQHQFGGTIGGPIVRDKAHFFLSVERILLDSGITINVPSRPEFNRTDFEQARILNTLIRADHQIDAYHTWGVRWLREASPQTNQLETNYTAAAAEQERDLDQTMVGTLNSVLGSTAVNSLKLSHTRENVFFANANFFANGERQDTLLPALQYQSFLDQQHTGATHQLETAYSAENIFSKFLPDTGGDHEMKFGVQYTWMSAQIANQSNLNGTFGFSHDLPFDAADPRTYPDRLTIRVPGVLDYAVKGHLIGLFAQDRWRPTNRLSVSLGVRYDLEIVPVDEADNPRFASPDDYPVDRNNVSPRLGVTYALDGAGRSVLRGGMGLFYQRTPFGFLDDVSFGGVFSDSFVVSIPTNNIDPGPSQARLPTEPLLAAFPILDRARLEALYPAGTRQTNSGAVTFDSPDRRLPYARQYSLGYERQIGDTMSLGVDFIRSEQRAQYMRFDLNPGLRASTSRTATVVRVDPDFSSNVWEIGNYGWIDYSALQMQVEKRASRGLTLRGAYTYSRGRGNTANGQNEVMDNQLLAEPRLELNEGPTSIDRPHVLSISGSYEVPKTGGLRVSGVVQARSGTPFTLIDSTTDSDRNGFTSNEYLPAGTYTGLGADALTVDYTGGRNGARGNAVAVANLRAGYRVRLRDERTLDAFLDVFNVTNRANFQNPAGDRRVPATFLVRSAVDQSIPARSVQLNFRYGF